MASYESMCKDFLSSIKSIRYIFCENGIQNGKGLGRHDILWSVLGRSDGSAFD